MPLPAIAAILIASVAALPGNVMPVLSGLLADHHGLDEAHIGYFVAGGTLAGLIASATAPYWISRVDLRWLLGTCLLLCALGLVGLAHARSLGELFAIQFVLGGSSIVVASSCVTVLARQRNPARVLGIKISSDVIAASAFLYFLPIRTLGLGGFLAALSACFVVVTVLSHRLPSRSGAGTPVAAVPGAAAPGAAAPGAAPLIAWLALATMIVFNVAGIAVWVFLGRLAQHAGLDADTGANVIAAGLFVGIAGALGAAALAGRTQRIWPQVCAGFVFVASIPALVLTTGALHFGAAVFVFNVAWNFFIPFVMGLLASRDGTGRLASLLPGTGMIGGILGPPLAGILMGVIGYDGAMFVMTAIAAIAVTGYAALARRR
jgi:hypothetical protein